MSAVVALNRQAHQDDNLSDSLFRLIQVWERIQTWGDETLALVQDSAEKKAQMNKVDAIPILQALQNESTVKRHVQGGGRLTVQIPAGLPVVHTDANLLTRLLQNLVKRAVMRSPARGEIRILAREYKGQVWIGISDDGPTANDADLTQSFDRSILDLPLSQSRISLELAQAKNILDRLDGQLWVGGGQGPRGSALIVCLPTATS
jgi:K+-sensing histidine kinase KdpD